MPATDEFHFQNPVPPPTFWSTDSDNSGEDKDNNGNYDYIIELASGSIELADCDGNDGDDGAQITLSNESSKRRARNAESAKRSRAKRRAYVSGMEERLSLANKEIEKLRRTTRELQNHLRIVKREGDRLRKELAEQEDTKLENIKCDQHITPVWGYDDDNDGNVGAIESYFV